MLGVNDDINVRTSYDKWFKVGNPRKRTRLGGGFKYFLFSPLFGEMIEFD